MKTANLSFAKLSVVSLALALVAGFGSPAKAQSTVDDWSHHRLVFSNPGTANEAEAHGHYDRWSRIVNSPRFKQQQLRRSSSVKTFLRTRRYGLKAFPRPGKKGNSIHQDWSQPTLAGGQVQPNMYPAKFSFDTTTADCVNDYVVYPTGVTGSAAKANIYADSNLYSGCGGTVPAVDWAYNTGTGYSVTTSPVLSWDGTQVAFIQSSGTAPAYLVLLKPAPNPVAVATSGSVSFHSTTFSFTPGTLTQSYVGANITGTGIPAADTIVSINTTTSTGVLTTRASANDGPETLNVFFDLTTPIVPATAGSAAAYRTCTAPCMYTISLGTGNDDTNSAPYYDYTPGNDTLYVGDDTSHLHKFTGVFSGTPTAVTAITLNGTSYQLASPVYDPVSGCVFVGDNHGYLYSANSGNVGTVCTSTTFSTRGRSEILSSGTTGMGIVDGVLLDSTSQEVYAFVTDSPHISTCAAGDNCVFQFDTSTITQGTTSAVPDGQEPVGTGLTGYYLYAGDFDNVYYSSASGNAGDLWVMGNTYANTTGTRGGSLYQIPISGTSTMGTPVTALSRITYQGGTSYPWPSPITEFCNNSASPCTSDGTTTTAGTDYIYFSVYRLNTATTNCGTAAGDGCVLAYSINTPTATPTLVGSEAATATAGTNDGCWATGGIVVDNSVPSGTLAGASEIYWFGLNGNSAGGPNGTTSTLCTAGTSATPNAIQDLQTL